MDLTYFNPLLQSESDFLDGFVARRRPLSFLLAQLRLSENDPTVRHHLIVAPRGFGKTSLLRRIAIAVRAEERLRERFIPLSFREEQHNVISLDILWQNCLQSLLDAREDEGASEGELEEIDAAWEDSGPRQELPIEGQDGEPGRARFENFCERLGRRPLLLIDNLDTLLAGLKPPHQWDLRKRLQVRGGPVMIAAASRLPASVNDREAAFYQFFRLQSLDRLKNDEVFACLRELAIRRGESGEHVLALLDDNPGRIAALNTLAGGNPRTLNVLYGVLESHASADVLVQLSAMLDTFTGWYQARIEDMAPQARAVFDALALNWAPMTAAELGRTTGLDTPAVSSQLSRLEKTGYVESISLSGTGKGRKGYELSERFFNIWYLMRNGPRRARQSVHFLSMFLQTCFDASERRTLALTALSDPETASEYKIALAYSVDDKSLRNRLFAHVGDNGVLDRGLDRVEAEHSSGKHVGRPQLETELSLDDLIGRKGSGENHDRNELSFGDQLPSKSSSSLLNEARALLGASDWPRAIEVYDALINQFDSAYGSTSLEELAEALTVKGLGLGLLGHTEQALEAFDDLLVRFGDATESALREQLASALLCKGITLGQLDRPEQEIANYDDLLARFGDATESALREQVAKALLYKSITLGQLDRPEQEIANYDDLLDRFGDATESALREQVAKALLYKGITLGQLDRPEQAIASYDDFLARFGDATESALREQLASALLCKGITLGQLDRPEQAIASYDDFLTRFGDATESALRARGRQGTPQQGHHARSARSSRAGDRQLRRLSRPLRRRHRERAARAGRQGTPQQGHHARSA